MRDFSILGMYNVYFKRVFSEFYHTSCTLVKVLLSQFVHDK